MNKLTDSITLQSVIFDGTSATVTFDLALPPINRDFGGNLPTAVIGSAFTDNHGNNIFFTGTITGTVVTLSCNPIPVAGLSSPIGFSYEF